MSHIEPSRMETPPPSSDSKPKAIIIGNVNISPMALQEQTQDTPPSIEPTVNRFDGNEHSDLHGLVRTRTDSTIKTSTSPDLFVMFLYYLPSLYLCMAIFVVPDLMGEEGAFFVGIMAPIIGFIVGLFHLRWEFFKGFLLQIGLSFPVAVLWCVAGAAGLFGNSSAADLLVDDYLYGNFSMALLASLLATLILPINYHTKSLHGRALGALYGAPLGVCLLLFGLLIGVISRYGIV